MSEKEMLEAVSGEIKKLDAHIQKNEKSTAQIVEKFDANEVKMKEISDSMEKSQEQLDNITSQMQRSGVKGDAKTRCDLEVKYNKAFSDVMRGKKTADEIRPIAKEYKEALSDVCLKNGDHQAASELKSFSTDKLATGGALIPVQLANAIIEKQRDFSDVRAYATTHKSDTTGLIFPGEAADFGFGWVGERENRDAEDSGEFNDVEVEVQEARAKVGITNRMRMNSAFDMDSYITRKIAQRLSRGEGTAFVTGDGTKKPKGFMSYSAGTGDGQVEQVTTVTSTAIDHKDLTYLKTPLRGAYRKNAAYYMNRFTEGYIENLEDDQGNPLFNRGDLAKGIPSSIKGFPQRLFDDMAGASASVLTGNDLVAIYGDMAEFYSIVDHNTSMIMFIDPYTGADDGKVLFRFHKFVGGGVTNFEAAKILKVKA